MDGKKSKITPIYCPNCEHSDTFGHWKCEWPCLFCLHNGIFQDTEIPGETKEYFNLKDEYK